MEENPQAPARPSYARSESKAHLGDCYKGFHMKPVFGGGHINAPHVSKQQQSLTIKCSALELSTADYSVANPRQRPCQRDASLYALRRALVLS
eukprot:6424586-Amphidinium_carterae.1